MFNCIYVCAWMFRFAWVCMWACMSITMFLTCEFDYLSVSPTSRMWVSVPLCVCVLLYMYDKVYKYIFCKKWPNNEKTIYNLLFSNKTKKHLFIFSFYLFIYSSPRKIRYSSVLASGQSLQKQIITIYLSY